MEKYLSIRDVKIWTTVSGSGTPLILCNGGPGCDDYLQPVADMLSSRCEVVRFEPRGCGRSDYDKKYDLQTTIEDIESIRKAYGVQQILIGGHSAGVDFALAYALRYPSHTKGIIGISGGRIVNDREWSTIYKKNRAEIGEDYGGKVFVADPEVNKIGNQSWREYIKRPGLLREISELNIPTVFIFGEKDIRPNWPTKQLARLLPYGQYQQIPEVAHNMWLTHPKELQIELHKAIDWILNHPSVMEI